MQIVSDALKKFVNHDPKIIRMLEDRAIQALSYNPKYSCGLSFEEFCKEKAYSMPYVEQKLSYGLYRMELDALHDKTKLKGKTNET